MRAPDDERVTDSESASSAAKPGNRMRNPIAVTGYLGKRKYNYELLLRCSRNGSERTAEALSILQNLRIPPQSWFILFAKDDLYIKLFAILTK